MLTKQELRDQLEEQSGCDLVGIRVADALRELTEAGRAGATLYWGCIPESLLDEIF